MIHDEFLKAADVPRLANTNHYPISNTLVKKLLKQQNSNVMALGLEILKALAKGLRRDFQHTAK